MANRLFYMLRMVRRIDQNMNLGIIPSHLLTIVVGIYPFLTTYHPSSVTTISSVIVGERTLKINDQ